MSTPNTHFGPERINEFLKCGRGVYFIGIGGVMMSSLALLTHRMGFEVRGSDRTRTSVTEELEREGISVFYGHDESNINAFDGCSTVIYTVAISSDNPEYKRAGELGIPCVSRADYLGYIMTFYQNRVGIAGMHGKSTVTSMCAEIFMTADTDPTVMSGAEYAPMGGAYRLGERDKKHFIFEACEYMDSFLDFYPTVAILLNAEMEHVDYFKNMEQIQASFEKFAAITGEDGCVIANADDEYTLAAAKEAVASGKCGRLIRFSTLDSSAELYADEISVSPCGFPEFTLTAYGKALGRVHLPVTGKHQIYNALASAAAALHAELEPTKIIEGLEKFQGAARRMDYIGKCNGADVYDDYGHHPTEIYSTLEGAAHLPQKTDGQRGRLICAFQPHTFSRTAQLFEKFTTAFEPADLIILLDIYSAREVNTYGVSSQKLAEAISQSGKSAYYAPSQESAVKFLKDTLREGDVAVIMGAGDIFHVSRAVTDK
ncbi:MAG: UDP-N-acetylmuramate--L-alanine ligase [Ruminococcaceae bacterium]|nr:UDP-N-acetylmuramate--L-alanine ligase [Oscillospiraceae bacterium]